MTTDSGIGMGSDLLRFYDVLAPSLSRAPFVEVGVWEGRSVIHLAKRIMEWRLPVIVFGVDTFDGGPAATQAMKDFVALQGGSLLPLFRANIKAAGVQSMVVPIDMPSIEAATLFDDGSLSGVCLDSSHEYAATREEIQAWLPKIVPGGYMCGHDYESAGGVKSAVDELFPKVSLFHTCWSYQK